ncbi:hypothetical protein [Chitinophaga sp.]|uniref:hypothetical protein n=1 Tax=Chitinophaga sp. TaxID=1869181 RepID=UPI002BC539D0|nr:hypothetical protein [Chitinophaga sp.]HWV69517.1 hypothetical protein [Chitinophaga sp.]
MKGYLIVLIALMLSWIMLPSCSSTRKTSASHQVESRQTDNSTVKTGYTRETTTTETGSGHVYVPGDSLSATGYVPTGDTGIVVSESDGMIITTTSVPKKDSTGKTIGSTINTKAKTKPKDVEAPLNKETHTKESGTSDEKKDVQTTVKEQDKSVSKSAWRIAAGIQILIGLAVIAGLIYGIYKLIKR